MPSYPEPKRKAYLPEKKRKPTSDQEFYNSGVWKKTRALKLEETPLCEFNQSQGRVVAADVIDHIIPISAGGSKLDFRNLMSLQKEVHERKSGIETHKGCLIAYVGEEGERFPRNRNDIFLILKK